MANLRERTYWQDVYVTLHIPRAACYFCFILIGSFLSPVVHWDRVILALVAAHFYLQWSAYAADEKSHHCDTQLSDRHLKNRVIIGMLVAGIIAIYFAVTISWILFPLALTGAVLILGYNFEVLGLHSRIVFGVAWGAYPVLTHFYLNCLQFPPLNVFAFGAVALIFALLHIQTYGNFFCGVRRCREKNEAIKKGLLPDRECHGQKCFIRCEKIPREVHKLQKKIATLQVYVLIAITIALAITKF